MLVSCNVRDLRRMSWKIGASKHIKKKKSINNGAQISQPITRRAWCSPEEDGWRIHHPNLIALSAFLYLRTPGVNASGDMTNDTNFISKKKKKLFARSSVSKCHLSSPYWSSQRKSRMTFTISAISLSGREIGYEVSKKFPLSNRKFLC